MFQREDYVNLSLIFIISMAVALAALGGEGKESAYLRQGEEYLKGGSYQQAVRVFGGAARICPDSFEAHNGLGMAYLKLGANEAASDPELLANAVAAFKEALRFRPDSAETRYHLGLAYLALYNKDSALNEYQSLTGLDIATAELLRARINSYKAPITYRPEKGRNQAGEYLTAVTINKNQVFIPVTLGFRDRTIQANLLLDTGASITVISTNLAKKLDIDLEKAPRSRAQVVGGGVVTGWHTTLDRLSAGPHTRNGIVVAVIPHQGQGLAIDGLLGMDFLRNYKYHIDFNSRSIDWTH